MLPLYIEVLTIVFFISFLSRSFELLEKELKLSKELEVEIYEKEYCSRLYALKKNLEQSSLYLKKEHEAQDEIIEAWTQQAKTYGIDCPKYIDAISLYQEQSLELDPLYPNWSYYYSLSNPNDSFSSLATF